MQAQVMLVCYLESLDFIFDQITSRCVGCDVKYGGRDADLIAAEG